MQYLVTPLSNWWPPLDVDSDWCEHHSVVWLYGDKRRAGDAVILWTVPRGGRRRQRFGRYAGAWLVENRYVPRLRKALDAIR